MPKHTLVDTYSIKEILNMYRPNNTQRCAITIEHHEKGLIHHILEVEDNCFIIAPGPMFSDEETEKDAVFQLSIDSNGLLAIGLYKNRQPIRSHRNIVEKVVENPSISHFICQRILRNTDIDFYVLS